MRHSVHIPDSNKHGAALELRDPITSVYRSRPSHAVEDSMISASSVNADTIMNSVPQFDNSQLPNPPRTGGGRNGPQAGRRGQTMIVRNRQDKFLSNSMMVSPNEYSPTTGRQIDILASGEQSLFKHAGTSKKHSLQAGASPQKVKCPPIAPRGHKRQTISVAPRSYRGNANDNMNKQEFVTG